MNNIQKIFEKNGYVIVPGNKTLLNKIRKIIFNKIKINKKIKNKSDNDSNITNIFNNFHKYINLKELNSLRFNIYKQINTGDVFSKIYYEIAKDYLDELVGNELSMQKKINLSIQMPKDKDSLLDLHSDIYAGESPFQVVVWIPLATYERELYEGMCVGGWVLTYIYIHMYICMYVLIESLYRWCDIMLHYIACFI